MREILRRFGIRFGSAGSEAKKEQEVSSDLTAFLKRFEERLSSPDVALPILASQIDSLFEDQAKFRRYSIVRWSARFASAGLVRTEPIKYKGKLLQGFDRGNTIATMALLHVRLIGFHRGGSVKYELLVSETKKALGDNPVSEFIHYPVKEK